MPDPVDDTGPGGICGESTVPRKYSSSTGPDLSCHLVKVDQRRLQGELLAQHQRDEEWFDKEDRRRLLVRLMTRAERVEHQISAQNAAIVIIARCDCCGCQYMRPNWGIPERVERLLFMDDARLLAEMDDQDRRFFQQLCEPPELTNSFPPAILRDADSETAGDRIFFEQNKDRNYRSRGADRMELETIMAGAEVEPPSGVRWFAIVGQVRPGVCVRRFVCLPETPYPDLSELACEFLFLQGSTESPKRYPRPLSRQRRLPG